MDEERKARLEKKYSNHTSSMKRTKQLTMNLTGRTNRSAALSRNEKPQHTKETVVRLFHYLLKERFMLILALLIALIFTITSLMVSYMLRPIMNTYIFYGGDTVTRTKGLFYALCVLAGVYALQVSSQWLMQRMMLNVSQKALHRMRKELYDKMEHLPIAYFDHNSSGDIMSRFTNDIDTIGEMLNTTLIQIVSGAITIVGTIALMLYTNWILAMITIIMTPVLTLLSKWIVKMGSGAYSIQQASLGTLNGFAEETIHGQKVVKVFNHESIAEEEFAYLNEKLCTAQINAQFRAGIMGPVTHQLCNACYALTACIGAILVVTRGFDIGGLTVSINYTRQFNRPINEISMQMNTVFAALAGAERVFALLDETNEEDKATQRPDIKGHISLEHVYFGYSPEKTVLQDITLEAKPGEKIAFVGSTGAGKTTVTNLLSRFYDLHSGAIYIDGINIEDIERNYLRSHIAMVLQDTHLFTGTVRENIRYGRLDATDEEVEQAAKIASAHSFIIHLQDGYDTVLEHDGANLSQGQRQLLNIARAALSKAPILILDEATSSVDTRTERHIEEGMDALMKNRTTFVIAHRLSTVRKSDKIMVLEHGNIIERGNHEELLAKNGRYSDLYNEIVELD